MNIVGTVQLISRGSRPRLFLWLIGFKVVYLIAIASAVLAWDHLDADDFVNMSTRWPRDGGPVFASHFATWDGAHYLLLSEVGYHHNAPSCAFYPLWPLLLRWTAPLFGKSDLIAGMVWSNLSALLAWMLFHDSVARQWGETAADWSLAFLIAFPGALFFQFPYTESLFLLLILVLWRGLQRERYFSAWLTAVLSPLTRGVGVFLVLPIAWQILQPTYTWIKRSRKGGLLRGIDRRSLGLLVAPLLGWGVYLTAMAYWTGDPFEGIKAQRFWGVHSIQNLWNVPKFVMGLFAPTQWHEFKGSVLDRCAFILLLSCLPFMWRLDKALPVWAYVLGVIPAMSGTFTSFTRFASCAFPMFITLGVFLSSPEHRLLRYALLGTFTILHIALVWRFANLRWAG